MKEDRIFRFVVGYLGFLKNIPVLPHIFDSFLRLRTFTCKPHLIDLFDKIEEDVLKFENTSICLHRYGGIQFNVKGKEIGHLHSNGLLDIKFNKRLKKLLINEGRAGKHHLLDTTGWISFFINKSEDLDYAIKLLLMSYTIALKSKSS